MPKLKILIADEIDTYGIKLLSKSKYSTECKFGISNSEIIRSYKNYDILLIRSIRKIDSGFLDKTTFKIIATCSKGTDHIDVKYALEKGVKILNAEDSNNISAAEHTLGLILAIEKNILLSDSIVRKGKFKFYNYDRNELKEKKIGIIGYGKVGSHVGKLSEVFGMKVYANDTDKNVIKKNKNVNFKSVNYIFKNCDIISVHIPLTEKNYKFISKEKLNLLRKESVFINTSRGNVVDEISLINLLKSNKIKFAGLDVFSGEPNINKAFRELKNVVVTNHIAGKTIQSRRKISANIFNQIKIIKLSMQK